jgi:DNA polymerase
MHPGRVTGYDGQELFQTVDNWLTMILPDGKRLWYWHPQLKLVMPSWHEPGINKDCTDDTCKCRPRLQVCYEANKSGRWRRVYTYGGKLTENRVQAVSRQLLKPVEIALERRGYPVVLSVYDEVVCDVPNNFGSTKEFAAIVEEALASLPWASGWPIRMDEPWEGQRYRK